jgi:flagellar hook-associated protein 3 FlgL
MSVSPVNVTRISNNLRTTMLLDSLRRNQVDLFMSQSRIASGRNFVRPSEDPVAAARALDLTQALSRQDQFTSNVQYGDTFLTAADSALTEINGLLIQASSIASQTVSNLTSPAEREAEAEVVTSIRQQLQAIGNRQFNGRYLFAGRDTTSRPFVDALGATAYIGDTGDLLVRPDDGQTAPISMPGSLLFGALSAPITSGVDLTPTLTADVRLEDLTGPGAQVLRSGMLVFNDVGGVGAFTVDLSTTDTIGGVVDAINAAAKAAGANVTASFSDTGIVVRQTPSSGSGGAVTRSLVLGPVDQQLTLIPRVTRLTPVAELGQGAGIDLESGIIVSNGANTATVDLSTAKTVQDIINAINNAGVFVRARINDAGTGIEVLNEVSGTSLSIGENGGTTATDLGIRTLTTSTPLTQLNFGNGVTTASGTGKADLRIVAKNAKTVDVDIDGAVTLGDVIDRINAAATTAGVAIKASLATTGNGIRIEDATGGTGDLTVALANLSAAPIDLGIQKTVSGTVKELVGNDVNPTRTEGILSALYDLETALRGADTQGITAAGGRLDTLTADVTRMHAIIGARSQTMATKRTQMEDATTSTQQFLSEVRDLDYAEAATKLQTAMTQLQANLQAGSSVMNLSLLDFLK